MTINDFEIVNDEIKKYYGTDKVLEDLRLHTFTFYHPNIDNVKISLSLIILVLDFFNSYVFISLHTCSCWY